MQSGTSYTLLVHKGAQVIQNYKIVLWNNLFCYRSDLPNNRQKYLRTVFNQLFF